MTFTVTANLTRFGGGRSFPAVLAAVAMLVPAPVGAAPRCVIKTASGTGATEDVAKFQVYEGLLRAVDSGLWSEWMASGTTPGVRVGKPVYACVKGMGLGVSCSGRSRICKS